MPIFVKYRLFAHFKAIFVYLYFYTFGFTPYRGRRIIEGIRFFSLDDTHKFGDKSKNTRSPVKLTIPIGLELRAFLINYIFPDNIPGGVGKYKHNPRYKIENDKVTIGIPETSWAEFLSTFPDENLNFS